MADPELRSLLRRLILPIYLPSVLYSAGAAAIVPVVPFVGLRLGFSVPQVALLSTVVGILTVLGPVPTGWIVQRVGERAGIVLGGALAMVASAGGLLATTRLPGDGGPAPTWAAVLFVTCVLVLGISDLVWDLGRQTYLADQVSSQFRGRVMTLFGGMLRIGRVVGPLLGAAAIVVFGPSSAFVIHLVAAALCTVLVIVAVPPADRRAAPVADDVVVPGRRQVLLPILTVGIAVLVLVAARTNRDLLLPLIGHAYGHSAALVSIVFALTSAAELLLILPAGALLDRIGRAPVLVACLVGVGVAYLLTPLAASVPGFVAMGLVFALGNGLGSGINKTLSADVTPAHHRARWLGVWNSFVGAGSLLGPAIVAVATTVASVATAGVVTGLVTLGGAVWAACWVPRYLPRPGARTMR